MRTLIRGGRVVDPANRVDAELNLLLEDGRVARVLEGETDAERVIDAAGRVVAPGFIDIHMHEDPVGADGRIAFDIFPAMLRMGVTTAVGGNCGGNVYDPLRYLELVDGGAPVNVALFAGERTFRHRSGAQDRYAGMTKAQKRQMEAELTKALAGGCVGVSFGLRYDPGTDEDELLRAAACCKASGKLIAAHVRDDADAIFGAIDEFAGAGAKLGLPVQISHIGSMGGFGQMERVLRQVDAYRLGGLDIAMDCYPYDVFSTEIGETTYDDGWLERYHCDYDALEFCEGKYKGQRATAETFAEMRRDFPKCLTICSVMKREDVELAYRHPRVMAASDGLLSGGQGHPRAAGTFPRVFAQYVRGGVIGLYEAVEKMTALPAERLGLTRKGRLNVGADADVVIFDPKTIADRATFAEPTLPPVGIDCVLIGGEIAVRDGSILNGRLGRAIRT